jgi:hypothetical protein
MTGGNRSAYQTLIGPLTLQEVPGRGPDEAALLDHGNRYLVGPKDLLGFGVIAECLDGIYPRLSHIEFPIEAGFLRPGLASIQRGQVSGVNLRLRPEMDGLAILCLRRHVAIAVEYLNVNLAQNFPRVNRTINC